MVSKKFDKELFDENDPPARKAFISFLDTKDVTVTQDPMGVYGIDLKGVTSGSKTKYYELEVVSGWEEGEFPWDYIHIPARKKKFIHPNVYFIPFRADLEAFYVISAKELTDERIEKHTNKYVRNEEFYDIPVTSASFVQIQ